MSLLPNNFHNGNLQSGAWIRRSDSLYTPGQITTWLSVIEFPYRFTEDDILHARFPTTLENLHFLVRLSLVAFPYENTMMHYSADHTMDISTAGLYQRIVIERRGSYCFGLNILFLQMLCGLGYRSYGGSGRINISNQPSESPLYTARSHMVIFVQPGEESTKTYLVDVACGGSGPIRPILLSDAEDNVVIGTTPTEKHRLTRGAHPESKLASSKSEWHLEVLHIKPGMTPPQWKVVYSFSEEESFPVDYESANFAVCRRPQGLFWENVVCSKLFWIDSVEIGSTDSEIDGSIMTRYMGRIGMEGRITRRHIGSGSEVLRTVSTETERAEVLREIFGMNVAGEDLEHIRGRKAALAMRISTAFVAFASVLAAVASPTTNTVEKRAISSAIYNDLVFYFKYASSVYNIFGCAHPNGNTLVKSFTDLLTDTQGFIARDDNKKEIIISLRGSTSPTDFQLDANVLLVPFISPGVSAPSGTLVHFGFLTAWNSVASDVIATVQSQLASHAGYTIVTTGHSLGGALSSIAGISLQQNFPNNPGIPNVSILWILTLIITLLWRTGNLAYANFVTSKVGASNVYRGVHTFDGVPTIFPTFWGYAHHATEYWQFIEPASASTTKQCNGGEDLTCSAGIISGGINPPHLVYYDILASTTFCT
ncbi:hypothetical protein D9615_000166 [Tricholomella constricta]|uniref:Fungal lipase-type domain-containing protein n=1 Tax=Tricholomella constricta TaxID=117010 RepID=A0A8H5HRF3_9AGAR|nr:hypothetical protein D9615_000166 [Tricholomella constricta]